MNILFIADPNSRFVTDLVEQVKHRLPESISVDLFVTHPVERHPGGLFRKISGYGLPRFLQGSPAMKHLFRLAGLWLFLFRSRYDIIHVLYAIPDPGFFPGTFRKAAPRRILTIFGSDFTIPDPFKRKQVGRYLPCCDTVTFANETLSQEFVRYYQLDPEKIRICRFGLKPLEILTDLHQMSREESRRCLGLPEERVIVSVGYNYSPLQQHKKILAILSKDDKLLDRKGELFFVFPFTYGDDPGYRDEVLSLLTDFPFDHKVISTFLTETDNAHLRRAPDIVLQLQQTDQLSGSMQESLYAQCVVISGSWLPYDVFKQHGIAFLEIDHMEELPDRLNQVILNLPDEKAKCRDNPSRIYALSSWTHTAADWASLYR